MVTVGSKIDLFTRVVMDKLNAAYDLKLKELDAENERLLAQYDKESKMRSEAYIEQFEKDGIHESKQLISRAKTAVRNKHIETRQAIHKEFERMLWERLTDFRNQEGYKLFLTQRIELAASELLTYQELVIECLEQDLTDYKDLITEALIAIGIPKERMTFRTVHKGIKGGLIFYDEVLGIRIDGTLEAVLDEQSRIIGILLSDILDEAGESDE